MAATVHRYGTPSWVKLPEVVYVQLRLAHELRNKLVELANQHDDARAQVYLEYSTVAAAQATLDGCVAAIADAKIKVNALRTDQRTRAPKGVETRTLQQAKVAARVARIALKEAIEAEKENAKPRLKELAEGYKLSIKALYALFVQERGLYWAVYNDVVDHHRTAEKRMITMRAEGRTAQLRFRRYTGTGALAVQPQRAADTRPRDPEYLASPDSKWYNVLALGTWVPPDEWAAMTRAEQRQKSRSTIRMRIGDEHVSLPAVLHRMLQPDADIVLGRLVVQKIADAPRASFHITAKIPDPAIRDTGPRIAVHCGWRHEDETDTNPEGIRVATWRANEPVDVPDSCGDIIFATGPTTGIVLLPETWRTHLHRPDTLRSERDLLLNPVREHLVAWLRDHPQGEDGEHPLLAANVAKWSATHRFATLAQRWRDAPPVDGALIAAELEAWRIEDRKIWRRQEHGRAKHLGRRTDAWRRVGAWIAGIAGEVVVDDTNLADLTRAISAANREDATPADVTAIAARQRTDAAAGDLRAAIVAAATRDGVTVSTVSAENLSRQHTCGHVNPAPTTRPIRCAGCGKLYDPDTSATLLMLMREPLPVPTPRPARARRRKADTEAPDTEAPDTEAPDTEAPDTEAPDTETSVA